VNYYDSIVDGMWMHRRETSAVTEVISIIMVISIISVALSVVILWAQPYMDDRKAATRSDSALIQFTTMNGVIQDVLSQGERCSRYANFATEQGTVSLSNNWATKGDRLILYYSLLPTIAFNISGLDDDSDFNVAITGGVPSFDVSINYLYPGSPPDVTKTISPAGGLVSVDDLINTVRIDIRPQGMTTVVGRIWLFDLGYIRYTTKTASGYEYNVIAENEGVISGNPTSNYLMDEPKNLLDDTSLVFRIVQFIPDAEITMGEGSATYRFLFRLNDTYLWENETSIPNDCQLKLKISDDGEFAASWERYFNRSVGFKGPVNALGEEYYYLDGGISFTLVQYQLDVSAGVIN
jgi:type II secretory pathway pseudopilin PulG